MGIDCGPPPEIKHFYSKEILWHFSCDVCKGWWTISDWEAKDTIACPHCTTLAKVVEASTFMRRL